ncbi:MAG: glycosyltransferase [Candidatus Methylumidiphilus sp.]
MKKYIGLCMIVKNEAHVIRRCLESALPLIDYVCIVDTGSSDGTQEAVRSFLREMNLPGVVVDEPWQDFAYNRSFALRQLREMQTTDYGLMIDADNVLVFEPDFNPAQFKKSLDADVYDVTLRTGVVFYRLPLLFSNRLEFAYKGVLHEYLDCSLAKTRSIATGFLNNQIQDSARNRNPRKYQDDAAVFEKALAEESDPSLLSRYTFYLAQSYRDCGEKIKSMEAYQHRSTLGYWDQEVFYSLYQIARLKEELGHQEAEVIQAYLAAYEACPIRAESLYGAIRFCRLRQKYQQGYIVGKHALGIAYRQDGLFVEQWIYDYGLLDEFSIAAYWAGHYRESFDACLKLLREAKAPPNHQERILQNADFAIQKLNNPDLRNLLPV